MYLDKHCLIAAYQLISSEIIEGVLFPSQMRPVKSVFHMTVFPLFTHKIVTPNKKIIKERVDSAWVMYISFHHQ